jgi:hypothetical protein
MPLSRLSPRSHQKGLKARAKTSSPSDGNARGNRSRHLNLWDAIQHTRQELDSWKVLSDYIGKLFRHSILPREKRMTNGLGRLTDSLINQFDNPQRDQAERSLLGLWIIQNFNTLNNHPFATASERHQLLTRFSGILDDEDPIESQLIRLLQRHNFGVSNGTEASDDERSASFNESFSEQSTHDLEEESEEPAFDFGWHKKASPIDETQQETSNGSANPTVNPGSDDEIDSDADFIDPAQLDERIRKSQNSLSVNRLFRQLAKVLHPDREQDEVIKAEKHLLMSQCLEARQKKDIHTLLQLYCEHVGDLPEDLTDTSHQDLISALELQLKLLQRELRNQRFGDALMTQIVERYSDTNNERIEANVALHAKQLDQEISENETAIERLDSKSGLQKALDQRRSIELDRMTIDEMTGNY